MRRARALLAALALLAGGCAWLDRDEPAVEPEDGLSVVDARGPFDPREAVDDDDAGDDGKGNDGKGGDGKSEDRSDERKGGDLAGEDSEEDVATPERAEAREEAQEAAADRAEEGPGDDDERKAEAAMNPPPEDPGRAEPPLTSTLDAVLELGVIVVLALVLSLALHPLHRHPKLALGLALGATLLAAAGAAVLA